MVTTKEPDKIVFLAPEDVVQKLKVTTNSLGSSLQKSTEHLPAIAMQIALTAHIKALEYLNDELVFCHVPWNPETNLPSLPSLAADIAKYAEILQNRDKMAALLRSFSGWTLLKREEMKCCCGKGFRSRNVTIDIMLNHVFLLHGGKTVQIRQMVAVRSTDTQHLEHYDFKTQSKAEGDLYIIRDSSASIEVLDSGLAKLEVIVFCGQAERFNVAELLNIFWSEMNFIQNP